MYGKMIKNSLKCLKCDTVIESRHVHDLVSCKCGESFVDGGLSYSRWMGDSAYIENLCVYDDHLVSFDIDWDFNFREYEEDKFYWYEKKSSHVELKEMLDRLTDPEFLKMVEFIDMVQEIDKEKTQCPG